MERKPRKSGLKSRNPDAGSKFKEGLEPEPLDMSEDILGMQEHMGGLLDLHDILERTGRIERKHVHFVTYTDEPKLFFVSFAKNKDRAKGEATKYYKETHINFSGRLWRDKYLKTRTKQVKELDKYIKFGAVPIHEVMEHGGKFPCSVCGGNLFTYKDYEDGRCFIIEEEGEVSPHINGYVLCYKCKKKYLE